MFICWVVVFVSLAGSVFFWLLNNSAEQAIKSKTQEKTDIINEMSSPALSDVELKATAFKAAVTELSKVSKSRYSWDEFLSKFYGRISQNTKVTDVSLTADGKVSISGVTGSYRGVADQILLLREWQINKMTIIKDVQLMSTSQSLNEETNKVEVQFAISGIIDKTQPLVEKPTTEINTQPTDEESNNTETNIDENSDSSADLSSTPDTTTSNNEVSDNLNSEGGSNATVQ
jgi:hypothetical protein